MFLVWKMQVVQPDVGKGRKTTPTLLINLLLLLASVESEGSSQQGPMGSCVGVFLIKVGKKMLILLLDRKSCKRHVFAAMVLCQLHWQNPLPTKIPLTVSIGEAVPVNWSAKCRFEGFFKRHLEHTVCLCSATCPGQSFQLHWENQGSFFILLKPHSTELGYKWEKRARLMPFWPTLIALGFIATMNLIALVAFPRRATGTVMYGVTAREQPFQSYLPLHWRVVKVFKNNNKLQLERGICHCEIVCADTCTGCLLGPEHRTGLDTAADTPSAFPRLVSDAGRWPYPLQIQLDFSFPHSNL